MYERTQLGVCVTHRLPFIDMEPTYLIIS